MQNILICSAGPNRITDQQCSINNAPQFDCQGSLDLSLIGLPSGVINISIDVTLQSQDTVNIELSFLFIASGTVISYMYSLDLANTTFMLL